MSRAVIPVILGGGEGVRLWPLSTADSPKIFLKLGDEQSLLARTFLRLSELNPREFLLTASARTIWRIKAEIDELKGGKKARYLIEPHRRNTAPAAAVAVEYLRRRFTDDAVAFFAPADHLIDDTEAFRDAAEEAIKKAAEGRLVILGAKPSSPHEGYGYIETAEGGGEVAAFVEKPGRRKAERLLRTGKYLWNCGIYCGSLKTMAAEFAAHGAEMAALAKRALPTAQNEAKGPALRLDEASFAEMPNISLDYAIAEKSDKLWVVGTDMGWEDIGSWQAVGKFAAETTEDAKNCVIYGDNITTLGVKDLIIAAANGNILVADKKQSGRTDSIAGRGENAREPEVEYRPWGYFRVLDEGRGFKVKRIRVSPGGVLSLQSHRSRSEHWVVVSGVAEVERNRETIKLKTGESVFLPKGCRHRLANRSSRPLEIIEVQNGDYLGEDDITRYEDIYGRK